MTLFANLFMTLVVYFLQATEYVKRLLKKDSNHLKMIRIFSKIISFCIMNLFYLVDTAGRRPYFFLGVLLHKALGQLVQ